MGSGAVMLQHDGLSRPLAEPRLRVLSLGAGVQSTTLALMAKHGDVPMPDFAIFADTMSEPKWVYDHLDWLASVLPFPIHRVSIGSLEEDLLAGHNSTEGRFASIPCYVSGDDGKAGAGRRQCTREYKLDPIIQETRRMLGVAPRQRGPKNPVVEMWIGISTDEIQRVALSRKKYIHHRHVLIEARMNRRDCETWLTERQYKIPKKSACSFCPYRSNAEWRDLKENAPDDFARAVRVDQAIRIGRPGTKLRATTQALHRSLRPLELIDFTDKALADGLDFGQDCMGMCGV